MDDEDAIDCCFVIAVVGVRQRSLGLCCSVIYFMSVRPSTNDNAHDCIPNSSTRVKSKTFLQLDLLCCMNVC